MTRQVFNDETKVWDTIDEVAPSFTPSIEQERAGMSCTPLQGKLAIGEDIWTEVVAYRDTAPWAQKMVIDSSDVWHRNSEDIQFLGYLLGVTDEQMDNLFRFAVTL